MVATSIVNLDRHSAAELAGNCADKHDDYSHEIYCLELFRRAVAGKSEECWQFIVSVYEHQVALWIRLKARGLADSELANMVGESFARFWQYFTPRHLNAATRLGEVLQYMRACAISTAQDWVRSSRRQKEDTFSDLKVADTNPDGDDAVERLPTPASQRTDAVAERELWTNELWTSIHAIPNTEQERRVAELSWSEGLKPTQIEAACPGLFSSVQQVYEIKRALLDRLGKDKRLQQLYQSRPNVR